MWFWSDEEGIDIIVGNIVRRWSLHFESTCSGKIGQKQHTDDIIKFTLFSGSVWKGQTNVYSSNASIEEE